MPLVVLNSRCLFYSIACFISDGVESEMSLVHEDDVDWFLTLDETHHKFSTVGAKGGATAGRYVNPSYPRSGEQCIVSNFHTTGVYGTTLRGDPLPHPYHGLTERGGLQDQPPSLCWSSHSDGKLWHRCGDSVLILYLCLLQGFHGHGLVASTHSCNLHPPV